MGTGRILSIIVSILVVSVSSPVVAGVYGQVNLTQTVVGPRSYMNVHLAQLGGPHAVFTSVYNVDVTPIGTLPFDLQSPIGFCLEAAQWSIPGTHVYTVVDVADAPNTQGPGGQPMGSAKADWISRLFGKHYDPLLLRTDSTYASAFQLSIWEIVYDTPQEWSLAGGSIWVQDSNSATTLATNWLNNLNVYDPFYGPGLVAFTNDNAQDYVMAKAVPEPISVMLGALGLGAVAAFRRLAKS